MTVNEIMNAGFNSAKTFLSLATQNNFGLVRYKLSKDPQQMGDGIVALTFESDVFQSASLCYRIKGQQLPEFGVVFQSYDPRTRTVRLKDNSGAFWGVKAEDVVAECSLNYLIERVRDFFHETEGIHLPTPTVPPSATILSENCSQEQEVAIMAALSAPLCFIQGGPGCGKTRMVLSSCIASELRDGRRILLTAPTNQALDVALVGVLDVLGADTQDVGVLRLGRPTRHLLECYPDAVEDFEAAKRYKELRNRLTLDEDLDEATAFQIREELSNLESRLTVNRIQNVSIVAATTDTFLARFTGAYALDYHPDHIYLDEAAYCPLIKALPLLSLAPGRLTMLGDVHQLPPVCPLGEDAISQSPELILWRLPAVFLGTVFEDSLAGLHQREGIDDLPYTDVCFLTRSYRYGQYLGDVLGSMVYHGHLTGTAPEGTEMIVLDAPARGTPERWTSPTEVEAIRQYLTAASQGSCAILTPYRKQAALLRQRLPGHWRQSVKTVHSTQGQEWDTVILSVVDNRAMFLTDSNNRQTHGLEVINTAVSRAKRRLVIVCDESFWRCQEGQLLQELIAIADTQNRNRIA